MSEKTERQIRRLVRHAYKIHCREWYGEKPPRWRIFRYLKWKKQKPQYRDVEKTIKINAKKRG